MKIKTQLFGASLAALGALSVCVVSGAAVAGSITQPGETVGLALGEPLPEGLFFVDTGSYGSDRGLAYNSNLFVNIPIIAWSTPWTFLGGRVEARAVVPSVAVGASNIVPGRDVSVSGIYNPLLLVGVAWDLGNHFGFSQFFGSYGPISNALEQNFWVFNSRSALSYTGDDWDLTAHAIIGITGNNQGFNAPAINPANGFIEAFTGLHTSSDYLNVDLTATKKFDNWELGVIAFGSTDISGVSTTFNPHYARQSQIAVGGLAGYSFGPIDIQAFVSRDVLSNNYVNPFGDKVYETRVWVRGIVPLWIAPAPAPVVAKY
jgi:Putative MetA-pathway of phenol degradation